MPMRRTHSSGSIRSLDNNSRHGGGGYDYYSDDDHSAMSSVVGSFKSSAPNVGTLQRTYSGLSLEELGPPSATSVSMTGATSTASSRHRRKPPQLRRSSSGGSLGSYNNSEYDGGSTSSSRFKLSRTFSFIYKPDPNEEEYHNGDGRDIENGELGDHNNDKSCFQQTCQWLNNVYQTYEIVILVIIAILIARAYPIIGAVYVQPKVTSSYIAVMLIFILAGMGLRTDEFAKATQRIVFNGYIQCYSFFFISSMVYCLSRMLVSQNLVVQPLADGMVICSCLPATINMVTVLTRIAGGDEAAAIFNCAFGNFLGIFLSPILILAYLGMSGDLDIGNLFFKLAIRVLTPILLGQTLQRNSKSVMRFVKHYRPYFKKGQQYLLVYIVYTVMCQTFKTKEEEGAASELTSIFVMIGIQFGLLVIFMIAAWYATDAFFPDQPSLRAMAIFGCTHKTVAMGVPMINAIYETDPNIGLLTLPLLIWHPMQLLMGSLVAPRIGVWSDLEKQRLGIFPALEEDVDEIDKKKPDSEEQSNTTKTTQTSSLSASGHGAEHQQEHVHHHHDRSHSREQRRDEYRRGSRTLSRSRSSGSLGYESEHSYGTNSDEYTYAYAVDRINDDDSLTLAGDPFLYDDGMGIGPESSHYSGRRQRLPKCRSDHRCYEVGVVYQLVTDPDVLLGLRCPRSSASKRCRGCGVRITSQQKKRGAHPTRATPVCICMECRRYLFCYHCWRENKAPEWAHTLYDLYN